MSSVLVGIQSSILFIHKIQDDISWSVICCYFGNGAIVSVLLAIYVLVNFVGSFQYSPNILDNDQFNYLTILLVIYGILSPLFLKLSNSLHNCRSILVCICSLFLIIAFPYVGWSIFKATTNTNTFYFYTVYSNVERSIITVQPFLYDSKPVFKDHYDFSDVYFDISRNVF